MTWRNSILISVLFFSGCWTGAYFTHRGMKMELRESKIEGIQCIADLIKCERKLEGK